ncbi:MAG: ABC transporter permease [Gammaproteobacteria bacterium]|nr:ABC transporter permease [Gammaproteobacteria bacterium]
MTEQVINLLRAKFNWTSQTFTVPSWSIVREKLLETAKSLGLPVVGILIFLLIWSGGAPKIETSLGTVPGPSAVLSQFSSLVDEHNAARNKEAAFYARQEERNARKLAENPNAETQIRAYTGSPTFFDQIWTSLFTVLSGFFLASIIAIPIGILSGLNKNVYAAINPIVQIFKPVSPLAWLPIVTMVVSALYVSDDPAFEKSYLNSMFTVMLCCLWPTMINTAVGVASINQDLVNVSKVLKLNFFTHIYKVVLPASIPMMFTGLRLSLGIAWMVLIAAEMLAQNPGLGKFVWDEFQNGSSNSLGRIMVAVVVIGLIGFFLDRVMLSLQKWVSWDKTAELR